MTSFVEAVLSDLRWLSGLLLGSVFVLSASVKLFHWRRFRDTLSAMELLPRALTTPVAAALPPCEAALGGAVLAGWDAPLAGELLVALLLVFTASLCLYRVKGGRELVCGCFADFEQKSLTSIVILRNALLTLAALPLLIEPAADRVARGAWEWLLALTLVAAVMAIWSLGNWLGRTLALLRLEPRLDGRV